MVTLELIILGDISEVPNATPSFNSPPGELKGPSIYLYSQLRFIIEREYKTKSAKRKGAWGEF